MSKRNSRKTRIIGARCDARLITDAKRKLGIDSDTKLIRNCLKSVFQRDAKVYYLRKHGKKKLIGEITRLTAVNTELTAVNKDLTEVNARLNGKKQFYINRINKLENGIKNQKVKLHRLTNRIGSFKKDISYYKKLNGTVSNSNNMLSDWKHRHAVIFIHIDGETGDVLHVPMSLEEYNHWKDNIPILLQQQNLPPQNPCYFIHLVDKEV